MKFEFNCPYCNHQNKIHAEAYSDDAKKWIVICDEKTGGCDKAFNLIFWVKPMVNVTQLEK